MSTHVQWRGHIGKLVTMHYSRLNFSTPLHIADTLNNK